MSLMQSLKRLFSPPPRQNTDAIREQLGTDELLKADIDRKHRELNRRLDAQTEVQRREPRP